MGNNMQKYIQAINVSNIKKGIKILRKGGLSALTKKLNSDSAQIKLGYHDWFNAHKADREVLAKQRDSKLAYNPKISIVVPTYNTPLVFLKEMIKAIIDQSYLNWELCIADGSDIDNPVRQELVKYQEKDQRIKVVFLAENQGISENTNQALALAKGDYIGLYDHDDILEPDCLYELVSCLQDQDYDVIYTDEDKLDDGVLVDPCFKPDFSIDLFCSYNYINHFFLVKKQLVDKVGGFNKAYEGAQDYDFMFRCFEQTDKIYHLPKILYHWRTHRQSTAGNPESKSYAFEAGKRAIAEHFKRMGIVAEIRMTDKLGVYHPVYQVIGDPLVSIIIPNREEKTTLEKCITSLYQVNTYRNIEIIIVENNSYSPEIFAYYADLERTYDNLKVIKWTDEFNYSLINNYGVKAAKGQYLLFLNNDTELISPDAIREMLGMVMREDVGIVGAKLLYQDNTVQHAGVVVGFNDYAGHINSDLEKDDMGYLLRAGVIGNYSAVTAACMLVDRSCFEQVAGFDGSFQVAGNDVDFCLRVRALGKLVVYNPFALWYHYESKSRGLDDKGANKERYEREIDLFRSKWQDILTKGDPYYNRNLL